MLHAFTNRIGIRLVQCYRGTTIGWHLLAGALTFVLVTLGIDWSFFQATRASWLYPLVLLAGLGGFIVPVVGSVGLYLTGVVRHRHRLALAGATMAQAGIIAWLITSFYKIFTGRIQPTLPGHIYVGDLSHGFQFGIWHNGIFWGWPSSHAAVACAGMVVLTYFYTKRSHQAVAYLWAAVVSLGAAVGFHWLSDVVAGVIIGSLVGVVVGKDASR